MNDQQHFVTIILPRMVMRIPVKVVETTNGKINLTPTEQEVFEVMIAGKWQRKEIASILGRSERAVQYHQANIYRKYEVGSHAELLKKFDDEA